MDFLKEALSELDDRKQARASRRTWVNLTLRMGAAWLAFFSLDWWPPEIDTEILGLVGFALRGLAALFTLVFVIEAVKALFSKLGAALRLSRGKAIWLKFHHDDQARQELRRLFDKGNRLFDVSTNDESANGRTKRRNVATLVEAGAVHELSGEGAYAHYGIDAYLWEYLEHTTKPWTNAALKVPGVG